MKAHNIWRRQFLAMLMCIPLCNSSLPLAAQAEGLPAGLTIKMIGLKERPSAGTSDRVADFAMRALACTNSTDAVISTWIGPYVIRAGKKYQPEYLDSTFVSVPPRSTVRIPVEVFCLDAGAPVAPPGTRFGEPGQWIKINTALPPLTAADLADKPGVTPVSFPPGATRIPTFPGTDDIFNFRIDPEVNFDLYLRYVHEVLEAVDDAWPDVQINTVLDDKPNVEEHVVKQTLVWDVIGSVTGNAFKVTDLEKHLNNAWQEGDRKKPVPAAVQSQLSSGAVNIWNHVSVVGAEAKVMTL